MAGIYMWGLPLLILVAKLSFTCYAHTDRNILSTAGLEFEASQNVKYFIVVDNCDNVTAVSLAKSYLDAYIYKVDQGPASNLKPGLHAN